MAAKKKSDPGQEVRAARARAMNPLLAALEASGLVTVESAAAARGAPAPVSARTSERLAEAIEAGKVVTAPATESAVLSAARATGRVFPEVYRRFLLTHGPVVVATDPPTTFTKLADLAEVTRAWWTAHRSLAALKGLAPTLDGALLISNHFDDRAIVMLACDGPTAGQVYVIAHDADEEPTPDPFEAWLESLLD